MSNPTENDIFDTRDLTDYRDSLESDLVDYYNEYMEDVENFEDVEDIGGYEDWDEGFADTYADEIEHYENVEYFCEELSSIPDFNYGETVIKENYFSDYCKDFVQECGYIPNDLPSWIEDNINWEGVAEDLRQDYSEADFEGETFYFRS